MITAPDDHVCDIPTARTAPWVGKKHHQPMTLHHWLRRYPPLWNQYTAHMTCSERGAVYTLFEHDHQFGNVPLSDAALASALGIKVEEWRLMAERVLTTYRKMRPMIGRRARK
jgi:hypothetical protein